MARTKKSEIVPQEENLTPGVDPMEMGEPMETADSVLDGTDTEQDLSELAVPTEDADAPLLLPDTGEGENLPGDGDAEAAPNNMSGSDWPPEDGSPLEEDSEPVMDGDDNCEMIEGDDGDETAGTDELDAGPDALWEELAEALIPSPAADSAAPPDAEEAAAPTATRKRVPRKKAEAAEKPAAKQAVKTTSKPRRQSAADVLTIEKRAEVETAATREEILWHEIQNAARTRRILTGTLGGIERLENGKSVAVVYYKELRVIIPIKEMMLRLGGDNPGYGTMTERENKILGNMLGCDIDFVLKGIDSKTRSAVASRREAMLRKRKTFYMDADAATGLPRIHEGRVVQARVIAVASKVVRVEAFGVETSIMARDLAWEWLGDAHERFTVGDKILVRINKIRAEDIEELSIQADARSMTANTVAENLQKCRVQGKYAGSVTDIHKGVVFIRLSIGVNAIAHSCLDSRMPAKQDEVSFVVTHIDSEQGVAMGLITRIIKQKI